MTLLTDSQPRLITTGEAARLLNVSPRTVLNWIERDAIPFVALPSTGEKKTYRIPLAPLLRSLSGNYDLVAELSMLDEALSESGLSEQEIDAALSD